MGLAAALGVARLLWPLPGPVVGPNVGHGVTEARVSYPGAVHVAARLVGVNCPLQLGRVKADDDVVGWGQVGCRAGSRDDGLEA